MAIRQTLTPERILKAQFSLQVLTILNQAMLIESVNELDVNFKVPHINQFAKRIGSDCKAIQQHLAKSGRMILVDTDMDYTEEYSSEIWRVVSMLAGMDIAIIKEFADSLESNLTMLTA